jgi:transcriptional regulator with XRE-family HTH domain
MSQEKARAQQLRIGRYFQHAREDAGMDQKVVADALSISVGTLSRYENGKIAISPAMQQRLASLYQVEPDGWRTDTDRPDDDWRRRPSREAPSSFAFSDPRYWSARWDQAIVSLRAVLREQEELAQEMRDVAYRDYRPPFDGAAPTPPVTPEALEQSTAAQIRPDDLKTDDQERAAK